MIVRQRFEANTVAFEDDMDFEGDTVNEISFAGSNLIFGDTGSISVATEYIF